MAGACGQAGAGAEDMTRCNRRQHLWMWIVLGPAALAVLLAGIAARMERAGSERADSERTGTDLRGGGP